MFNFKKAISKVFGVGRIGRVQKSVKRQVATPQAEISLGTTHHQVATPQAEISLGTAHHQVATPQAEIPLGTAHQKIIVVLEHAERDALTNARYDFFDYLNRVYLDDGYYDSEELTDACKAVGLSIDDFLSIDRGKDFMALIALIDSCTCGMDETIKDFEHRLKTAVNTIRKGNYTYYDVGNYEDLGRELVDGEIPPEYESYVDWYGIGKDWCDDNGAFETSYGFIATF